MDSLVSTRLVEAVETLDKLNPGWAGTDRSRGLFSRLLAAARDSAVRTRAAVRIAEQHSVTDCVLGHLRTTLESSSTTRNQKIIALLGLEEMRTSATDAALECGATDEDSEVALKAIRLLLANRGNPRGLVHLARRIMSRSCTEAIEIFERHLGLLRDMATEDLAVLASVQDYFVEEPRTDVSDHDENVGGWSRKRAVSLAMVRDAALKEQRCRR